MAWRFVWYIQRHPSLQLKEENYTHCSSSSPQRHTEERLLTLIVPNVCQYSDFIFPSLKKGKPRPPVTAIFVAVGAYTNPCSRPPYLGCTRRTQGANLKGLWFPHKTSTPDVHRRKCRNRSRSYKLHTLLSSHRRDARPRLSGAAVFRFSPRRVPGGSAPSPRMARFFPRGAQSAQPIQIFEKPPKGTEGEGVFCAPIQFV